MENKEWVAHGYWEGIQYYSFKLRVIWDNPEEERRWLIRNQNTRRKDERVGNKSIKENCGKIHENAHSVHSVTQ
jgi:hypothetical protein